MIDATTLMSVYGISRSTALAWELHIRAALQLAECNTKARTACWLAQIGHESGRLRYTKELWGPTAQQKRYEVGTTLADKLGNTEVGDGPLYMGRGLIQTTGRSNYAMTTVRLREFVSDAPDFEADPALLQQKKWAALSAGLFWRVKKLNKWADSGDYSELTRRINGGYNGMADRQALLARALIVL